MHFGTRRWSARLICADEGLREAATALLGGLSRDARDLPPPAATFELSRHDNEFILVVGEDKPRVWPDRGEVLVDLHWNIVTSAFRSGAGGVSIHAGLVDWGTGGVLITGASEHGKSTLVVAACRAGALFGGDDLTWFDPDALMAVPFPITPKLSRAEADHRDEEAEYPIILHAAVACETGTEYRSYLDPDRLCRGIAEEGPLAAVIIRLPRYTGPADLIPITPAAGLQRLFDQARFRREDRVAAFEGLSAMLEQVPVFEAVGEAGELVGMIPERIAAESSEQEGRKKP